MTKVLVRPGTIEVETMRGLVEDDRFVIFITTREKYVETSAFASDPASIMLSASERTLRFGEAIADMSKEEPTIVEVSGDWFVEASGGRYTCCVVGVRRPPTQDLPAILFTIENDGEM